MRHATGGGHASRPGGRGRRLGLVSQDGAAQWPALSHYWPVVSDTRAPLTIGAGYRRASARYAFPRILENAMSEKTLADVTKAMRHIDIAILSSVTASGAIAGRPMSNNKDVDFDGDSYYHRRQ